MRKRLILVRHAKSSWKDLGLADFDRPLSKRGRRDGPRMAAHIRETITEPALILCSDSKRTRSTAKYICKAFGLEKDRLLHDHRLYMASITRLWEVIAEVSPAVPALMLIGHNPGLTQLYNRSVPADPLENIPTFGVVEVEFATDRWDRIRKASGKRLCFHFPKMLGAGSGAEGM